MAKSLPHKFNTQAYCTAKHWTIMLEYLFQKYGWKTLLTVSPTQVTPFRKHLHTLNGFRKTWAENVEAISHFLNSFSKNRCSTEIRTI